VEDANEPDFEMIRKYPRVQHANRASRDLNIVKSNFQRNKQMNDVPYVQGL